MNKIIKHAEIGETPLQNKQEIKNNRHKKNPKMHQNDRKKRGGRETTALKKEEEN